MRTVGVEEEFLLLAADGRPTGVAQTAVRRHQIHNDPDDPERPGGGVEVELKEQQLETGTHPCSDAAELDAEIRAGRRRAADAAQMAGARLAALATSPLPAVTSVTDDERYQRMAQEYGMTLREQLTGGCHVHVQVADEDEGVAVLDRIGPWLAPLLALSANSPFWQGTDTGYASFRSQVWNRWPTAGPTAPFGSAAGYHEVVAGLIATGAAMDDGMIYFDARLSAKYPTVEVRVADVCLRAEHAVLIGVLVRALVETAARSATAGESPTELRVERLRAASWLAGRAGMSGDLVHPVTFHRCPAADALTAMLDHLRPVLQEQDEWDDVRSSVADVASRGGGATEQRRWRDDGGLASVVERAVAATMH